MSQTKLILLAAAGSLALIAGAYLFQALGYAPCKMCYWQRWPHFAAVAIGAFALWRAHWLWAYLGALAAAVTGGIGVYHSGVEQKWWAGPSSCSGGGSGLGGQSGTALLSTDVLDKVVMCDEISWQFLALSMPSWNALISLSLMVVWIIAAGRMRAQR